MSDFQDYITFFLILLISMFLVRAIVTKTRGRARLPPSPLALPIIGHLHLMAPIPHQALHKLSTCCGPLIHFFLGSVPCVVASSPDVAREFLKTHESSFFVNVWALGRDPNYWENPVELCPERFASGSAGKVEMRGQHFQMLPFGSGRKGCPGTSLALLVVQTCLAAMVQCSEWKVNGGYGSVDMEEGPGLTFRGLILWSVSLWLGSVRFQHPNRISQYIQTFMC